MLAMSLLLPLGIAAHVKSAAACGNEVIITTDDKIRDLSTAEKALGSGKITAAAETAFRYYPKLHTSPRLMQGQFPNTGLDPVAAHAQRLVAVALVRTEGLLTIKDAFEPTTADERRKNLEWAIAILRAVAAIKKSPALDTDLGEALSKLPETRDEALSILDGLDKKDLVTSPEAYAALAELRKAAGDSAGGDAAQQRYERMKKAPPLRVDVGLLKQRG